MCRSVSKSTEFTGKEAVIYISSYLEHFINTCSYSKHHRVEIRQLLEKPTIVLYNVITKRRFRFTNPVYRNYKNYNNVILSDRLQKYTQIHEQF